MFLSACQSTTKYSIIGSWKIETISSPDSSTHQFNLVYDRTRVDSLASIRAKEYNNLSEKEQKNSDSVSEEMVELIAESLNNYNLITMTFEKDSTVLTENFNFEIGNTLVQRWTLYNNRHLRFYEMNNKSDTGVAYFIKFISNNQCSIRQSDPNSRHASLEYVLVRK